MTLMSTTHDTKQYAITLTYKCNWNCSYCAVRNSVDYKPAVTVSDVLDKINQIEDGSIVTLFGGEPGILDRDVLELYISELKSKRCTLKLETNGLFLHKYPELCSNFQSIVYHCSEDLEEYEVFGFNHPDVTYMLIIHDQNINRLEKFLEINSHIEKFYIVEATYPHEITGPTLSKQNKNHLLTKFCKHMTPESIKRLIKGHDFSGIIFMT